MYTPQPAVLTVTQLNNYVKALIEGDENVGNLWVTGEISNYKHHSSGHMYFVLKDAQSSVRAVMFAGAASKLRFVPEDGMKVTVLGRSSVYTRDGSFQVYVDGMQPEGLGALSLAFTQLKEKLEKEGLFAVTRKKPLPPYPARVGVITSGTGAAVRDILYVLGSRWPQAQVMLYPVAVQGEDAARQNAEALRYINSEDAADVIIIGRGGGSIEDLWAYNEEILARAVAESRIPVISGVGHETDYTICDFVADYRAPTPTAAAQVAVPDCQELAAYVATQRARMNSMIKGRTEYERQRITSLKSARVLRDCRNLIDDARQRTENLRLRAQYNMDTRMQLAGERLSGLSGRLSSLNPAGVFARGYTAVSKNGRIVAFASELHESDEITVRFQDGNVNARVIAEQE